jgi:D-tagatose-bisphosphate aldolase class II non-catalytic subunit
MTAAATLRAIVTANRADAARGIASWCTAHPDTLRAIFRAHTDQAGPILIEATCNQVNQHGGYTGMTPAAFRRFIEGLALETGVDKRRIILGGDHLGPNPWRHLAATAAMAEAKAMVQAYVEAGFSKIHLDASMACADDVNLTEDLMAARAAELCAVAEAAATVPLTYVIGTEVPIPGGETATLDTLAITSPEAALRTHALHQQAFAQRGLDDALSRVIAIVVQPGVDFGNDQVFPFVAGKAATLTAAITAIPNAVFEAHSTDYQSGACLSGLVASHFAILKVGPELTFAYREAVFAMAEMEQHLPRAIQSDVISCIDAVMNADDKYWRAYVPAGDQQRLLKLFGLSDRVRYYWSDQRIARAVALLMSNIDRAPVPRGLVEQYAGTGIRDDGRPLSLRIIDHKVGAVVRKYLAACGSPTLV